MKIKYILKLFLKHMNVTRHYIMKAYYTLRQLLLLFDEETSHLKLDEYKWSMFNIQLPLGELLLNSSKLRMRAVIYA
jgi:hypothetical protein